MRRNNSLCPFKRADLGALVTYSPTLTTSGNHTEGIIFFIFM